MTLGIAGPGCPAPAPPRLWVSPHPTGERFPTALDTRPPPLSGAHRSVVRLYAHHLCRPGRQRPPQGLLPGGRRARGLSRGASRAAGPASASRQRALLLTHAHKPHTRSGPADPTPPGTPPPASGGPSRSPSRGPGGYPDGRHLSPALAGQATPCLLCLNKPRRRSVNAQGFGRENRVSCRPAAPSPGPAPPPVSTACPGPPAHSPRPASARGPGEGGRLSPPASPLGTELTGVSNRAPASGAGHRAHSSPRAGRAGGPRARLQGQPGSPKRGCHTAGPGSQGSLTPPVREASPAASRAEQHHVQRRTPQVEGAGTHTGAAGHGRKDPGIGSCCPGTTTLRGWAGTRPDGWGDTHPQWGQPWHHRSEG